MGGSQTDLSKDFKLWEFVISQTAERHGINNNPPPEVVQRLTRLCKNILQPARDKLGPLKISSGYRCPELNSRIGGSPNSGHKLGYCADVLPVNCSKMAFARFVAKNCQFDQIILEFGSPAEPAWIHVSADPRNRQQILRILPGTSYVEVNL
jgi:hypothetical protein